MEEGFEPYFQQFDFPWRTSYLYRNRAQVEIIKAIMAKPTL